MFTNTLVAQGTEVEKAEFYKKTYLHVAGAILAFILVETFLLKAFPPDWILMMVGQRFSWMLILGIFWLGSMLSSKWSLSQSKSVQYAGLGFYVILEAFIFLPIMYIAVNQPGAENVILQAASLTVALFGAISLYAFTSKTDFSFLRFFIIIGGFLSLGVIVGGSNFGFNTGLWFSVFMIVLASASILYQTSKLKDSFTTGQYVGASLQLFSSIMLMFWYILRIFLNRRN